MRQDVQSVFKGLSDPTRRSIVELLSVNPSSVSDLVDEFDLSRNAVVKHLKVLENAGIVVGRPTGRERINFLNPAKLKLAYEWLTLFEMFWDNKLENLKRVVEEKEHD